MKARQLLLVSDNAETEALLAQHPGWGRAGKKNGLAVIYVSNRELIDVLLLAGGEVLGRPNGAVKAISNERVSQLEIELPRKNFRGEPLPPRAGETVKTRTDEVLRSLSGDTDIEFDW